MGQQWYQGRIKRYLETNENEETKIRNLLDTGKAILRGKFIALQVYLKKTRLRSINTPFPCPFASSISIEKSTISLIAASLKLWGLFKWCILRFSSCLIFFDLKQFHYNVTRCDFICIYVVFLVFITFVTGWFSPVLESSP